ncbi:RNA ligase [Plasticicumulans lactativorans]|uniref:RNA ligase n=1 Tax=Plasticicumulans lactativorans TaxID=1133106 RepID=A0A4R2L7I0_9GAMM|nr:RNA ligase family protein [Plasticicumulans lactativorans]TCO81270.1 RNA ligase [Plasticicumulans lactativorans]
MTDFFRFPHTPHLAWLGRGTPRDDKVLSPAEVRDLLQGPVVVEEKLDGANLGVSVSREGTLRAQNRGQYLHPPYAGQFARLGEWLARREDALFDALGEHLIAFGEWCAARHSLDYAALPDWWLLFDVYDRRAGRFWSTRRRDAWAQGLRVAVVPAVARGRTSSAGLQELLRSQPSRFRDGPMEGVVVRVEDDDWLLQRAKLVRTDFTQQIEAHWRSRTLEWNRLQARP